MASEVTIKTIGDWKQKIEVSLQNVLNVSMEIMGRTGEEACRHALILMAQSARAATKIAPKKRPVEKNSAFRHLLRTHENGSTYKEARVAGRQMASYYQYFAIKLGNSKRPDIALYGNEQGGGRERIAKIGNRGIAKRSWMWGLAALGASGEGKPIADASKVFTVREPSLNGYVKENRLDYILKAMPAGWERDVETKAGNKIMANAVRKMEADFNKAQWTSGHQAKVYASQFFLPVNA